MILLLKNGDHSFLTLEDRDASVQSPWTLIAHSSLVSEVIELDPRLFLRLHRVSARNGSKVLFSLWDVHSALNFLFTVPFLRQIYGEWAQPKYVFLEESHYFLAYVICQAVLYVSSFGLLSMLQKRGFTGFQLFSDHFTEFPVALILRQALELSTLPTIW